LLTKISKLQGPKRKWPLTIEWRRFKENRSSSSAHQTRETDAPAITTPAITVLSLHYQGRRMPFSDYKSQRRDARGGREKKATNGREQERVTKETGKKRNTKKKTEAGQRETKKKRGGEQGKDRETNKTEESKFSAPVSSQRNRGFRASRS